MFARGSRLAETSGGCVIIVAFAAILAESRLAVSGTKLRVAQTGDAANVTGFALTGDTCCNKWN